MSSNDDIGAPSESFEAILGNVSIAYNRVQYVWLMLFGCYLMGDTKLAKSMFEALRNDASQRDMIMAAANVALAAEPTILSRTKILMQQTNALSAERNAAVHTFWDKELSTGALVPTPGLKKHGKLEDDTAQQFRRVISDLEGLYYELLTLTTWTLVALSSDERYLEPQLWPSPRPEG